jgi:hypothetical protein
MMPSRTRFDEPRWLQCILKLTRIVTIEQRRRLVCIPDRMMAENERDTTIREANSSSWETNWWRAWEANMQRQHGASMTDARISKNGKGRDATWTVSYTLRETRTEELF